LKKKKIPLKTIFTFFDQKLQLTYLLAYLKDVRATGEALSPQKRTSSTWQLYISPKGGLHASINCFLAGAEMTESSDCLLLVKVGGCGLHPPDGHHLVVILHNQTIIY
jgi:hypothetical protein